MPNITATFVKDQKLPGDFRDDTLKGFVLDVSSSGVKSYKVNGRIKGGKTITYVIGKHGAPWNAATARAEAEEILRLMKTGQNPKILRDQERAAENALLELSQIDKFRQEFTLAKAFDEWCVDATKTKQSTKTLYRYVIQKHLKAWLDVPLSEITPDMVCKRYAELVLETVGSANNAFRALRQLFNWSIMQYEDRFSEPLLSRNPVSVLARRDKWESTGSRNDQYIADDDLQSWFKAVLNVDIDFRDYFIFTLFTGLRKNESAKLRWSDVDFKRNRFTVKNTKNGTNHTLPMTDLIRALLLSRQGRGSDFVFPGDGANGYIGDIRFSQRKIVETSNVPFTPHALRRTFSFAAESVRLGDTERKKLLNHMRKSDVTDAHYSPRDIDKLREPLEMVERHILKLAKVNLTRIFRLEESEVLLFKRAAN